MSTFLPAGAFIIIEHPAFHHTFVVARLDRDAEDGAKSIYITYPFGQEARLGEEVPVKRRKRDAVLGIVSPNLKPEAVHRALFDAAQKRTAEIDAATVAANRTFMDTVKSYSVESA